MGSVNFDFYWISMKNNRTDLKLSIEYLHWHFVDLVQLSKRFGVFRIIYNYLKSS